MYPGARLEFPGLKAAVDADGMERAVQGRDVKEAIHEHGRRTDGVRKPELPEQAKA